MSRPLRIEYPGAWYHIMNRGRRRENIFTASADYQLFVDVVKETAEMFNLKVSAYCLMSNHYHLLVHTPDGNLSRCMRHINGVYTQRYNRVHQKDGQLFRGRFKAVLVDSDSHLLEALRYIHNNPVRAGIVMEADDFEWSSHKGYCSNEKNWGWLYNGPLLGMFSRKIKTAQKAYLEFMQLLVPEEIETFYGKKNLPSILGKDDFKEWIADKFKNLRDKKEIPASKELAVSSAKIQNLVCKTFKVDRATLMTSRRGIENIPRDIAIYLQRRHCRQTLIELGKDYNIANYSSVSSAYERAKLKLQLDRRVSGKVLKIEEKINKSKEGLTRPG